MMPKQIWVPLFIVGSAFIVAPADTALAAVPAMRCESLASLKLTNARVTLAASVGAGDFVGPAGRGSSPNLPPPNFPSPNFKDLPAFCRVALTLTPSSDSDIKVEVWLPLEWNGKFEGTANGAYAGAVGYAALADAQRRRYAAANTDTGHAGNSGSFALGHPEKVVDFGYRAVHEMSVAAKAVVTMFYGAAPKFSYWNGCSTGGRQALEEAQKYPNDYDGIIAGAPANNTTRMTMMQLNVGQAIHKDEASYIPASKFKAIHEAVLAQCDAIDGVKDGVLEDPTRCKFDPTELLCKRDDSDTCLTMPQIIALRRIYAPTVNPRTKEVIFPGLEPGGELGWSMMINPEPFSYADDFWKYFVMKDASWDYKTLNFATDLPKALAADHGVVDATDPNLTPFFGREGKSRGGKLIQYHGWSDPGIAPENSVNYYKQVTAALGAEKVKDSYRLFMVPGMAHCRGGEGTDTFDMLWALEAWVEHGRAPERINAVRFSKLGAIERERPLCPYPAEAVYKGSRSTDKAENFACAVPK
jgi:feruloyl esterase